MSKLWILVLLMILSGCSSLPDKDFPLEMASYGSKSTEKGIAHIVTTTGRVRIFELPSKNLVKDIPFNDNSRENSVNSKNRDTLYQEALYSSIGYGVFDYLLGFFHLKELLSMVKSHLIV